MTGLGKEYGEALYELARDEHLLDELTSELTEISALLKQQPDFIRLLCSRAVERDKRLGRGRHLRRHVHPYVSNFMKLLVEKERFEAFLLCCEWFHQRYNEDYRVVEAYVTSAVPLSNEDRRRPCGPAALADLGQKVHPD